MKITPALLEQLLYEDESSTLDFKRDQYPFEKASDERKGELLKDILAFANAFRRTTAYILIGVEHRPGQKSQVVGVTGHIDDADLQQFVNGKTQRPVAFAYQAVEHEGRQVGVIEIPQQPRPLYLRKDYGRLRQNAVYVRRGSSTALADPDEVARMGAQDLGTAGEKEVPTLEVELADEELRQRLGRDVAVAVTLWELPSDEDVPDYGRGGYMAVSMSRRSYYRDVLHHRRAWDAVQGFAFVLENTATVVASDVVLDLEFDDPERTLTIVPEAELPEQPRKDFLLTPLAYSLNRRVPDVSVKSSGTKHWVKVNFGKVQPKATVWSTDRFYLGASRDVSLEVVGWLRADNLPDPKKVPFCFKVAVAVKPLDWERTLYEATTQKESD